MANGNPVLVYFGVGPGERLEMWQRYETVQAARNGAAVLKARMKSRGLFSYISYAKPEPNTGTFEIAFTFASDTTVSDVYDAVVPLKKPPCSNRGVTTSRKEKKT